VALSVGARPKDGSNLRRGQRPPVESQFIDIALEVDVLVVPIPIGVMPAEPERLWNVQVRQGNITPVFLAHPIHKDGSRLRWEPLYGTRHMVPASVGDAGSSKGTAAPASVPRVAERVGPCK